MSSKNAKTVVIASLIQTSIGPSACSTAAAAASTASASATSQGSARASPPAASTSRQAPSRPARLRAIRPIRTPGPAKRRTIARPIPLDAPVTTMTRDMPSPYPRRSRSPPPLVSRHTPRGCTAVRRGTSSSMREADRFPPVRDLAAIGDKRTIALVARDGTLEWMCVAGFDGDPVFASLLDRRRGGRFALAPADAFEARRRYLPDTNVLETTFATSTGEVRVTDALTLASESATPYTELVRRIDGVAGRVELAWHLEPRFDFGRVSLDPVRQEGASVFHHGDLTITLQSHRAGEPHEAAGAVHGRATVEQGDVAALVMGVFDGQPAALASL